MLARTRPVGFALALAAGVGASAKAEPDPPVPVALELVLAVDASSSVHAGEFELQVEGLAAAFRDPEVVAAIEGQPDGIAVALVQWSNQQVVAVDWTQIADGASADAFAAAIQNAGRLLHGETGLARVLSFAWQMIDTNGFDGQRRVIDVSGDGPANVGPHLDPVRDAAVAVGITINGLAVVNEYPELGAYYRDHVVGGPDAFVLEADDYDDFARAMQAKLLDEIRGAPVAAAPEPPGTNLARRKSGTGRSVGKAAHLRLAAP